jgi:hypothetical protein
MGSFSRDKKLGSLHVEQKQEKSKNIFPATLFGNTLATNQAEQFHGQITVPITCQRGKNI